MRIRTLSVVLALLLAAGCSDLTAPESLVGSWKEADTFPGNSLGFTLEASGDAISGSGTWTGEACCAGTVTITGTMSSGTASLDFTYVATSGAIVPTRTAHFTGRLTGANSIVGSFGDQPTYEVVFLRMN